MLIPKTVVAVFAYARHVRPSVNMYRHGSQLTDLRENL